MNDANPEGRGGQAQPASLNKYSALMLLVALLLQSLLIYSSFDFEYRKVLATQYGVSTDGLRDEIQRGLDQGRTLQNYEGIRALIERAFSTEQDLESAFIVYANKSVRYSSDRTSSNTILPGRYDALFEKARLSGKQQNEFYSFSHYVTVLPIQDPFVQYTAYLVMDYRLDAYRATYMEILTYFLFLFAIVFFLFFSFFFLFFRNKRPVKRIVLTVTVVGFQLLFSLGAMLILQDQYSRVAHTSVDRQLKSLETKAKILLKYELMPQQWTGIDKILKETAGASEWWKEIFILDSQGRKIYAYLKDLWDPSTRSSSYSGVRVNPRNPGDDMVLKSVGTKDETIIWLGVRLNQDYADQRVFDLALDIVNLVLVSFLIVFEIFRRLGSAAFAPGPGALDKGLEAKSASSYRFAIFLFFSGAFLPFTIIPNYVNDLVLDRYGGLNSEFIKTLLVFPMSMYLLGVGLSILGGRFFHRAFSFRWSLQVSALLFILGNLVSLVFLDYVGLLIGRLLSGLGHGLLAFAGTDFNRTIQGGRSNSKAFREWNGGFASGAISGLSIGGLFAARFGVETVLVLSSVILVVFWIFIGRNREIEWTYQPLLRLSALDFVKVLRGKNSLKFFFLLFITALPLQIATIGLFHYVFPLFIGSQGLSLSTVARILTIYGFVSILTPLWQRVVEGYRKERMFIIAGNMISGISLLAFVITGDVMALTLAIISIGIGSMLVDGINHTFIHSSVYGRLIGKSSLGGVYRAYEDVSSMVIPLVSALLVIFFGVSASLGIIGFIALIGSLLYAQFTDEREVRSP